MKKQLFNAGGMLGAAIIIIAVSASVHNRPGQSQTSTDTAVVEGSVTEAETEKVTDDAKQMKAGKMGDITVREDLAGVNVSLDSYSEKEVEKEEISQKDDKDDEDTSDEEKQVQLNLVYDRLGIAKVDTYLNVRKHPSESSKIVGKMTKNAGCNVYKIKKGWAKIVSGGVYGWVKAKYLVTDKKAEKMALEVGKKMIAVETETLNVREFPTTESKIWYMISQDDDYIVVKEHLTEEFMEKFLEENRKNKNIKEVGMKEIMSDLDNWACIRIDNDKVFVSKDYVDFAYKLNRAVGIKEVSTTNGDGSSTGVSSTRASMVNYAMQFLGNRYVYGGTSLTNGTDCSGFTMRIYEHFGVSIPRTSSSQAAAARSISYSEARPGDLFFYGSGSVSHVAMYIGNGQVIHASNPSSGIKISTAYYRTPLKIGRFID